MSYTPNAMNKKRTRPGAVETTEPMEASDLDNPRCACYAAQFDTIAPNETIDPAIVDDPGFSETIARFLSGTSMSAFKTSYTCVTQARAQPDQLFLGWNGKVTLWRPQSTINFAAYAGGYPTADHAIYAAYHLNEAVGYWNATKFGVTFKWVKKLADAEFVLAYGGDGGDTLARAFFPNAEDLNTVFVYKRAFDPDTVNYQSNIFAHEVGHIIGLRHEFAPQEGGAVLFGNKNPNSVMSYKFPPVIQKTDKETVRRLYKLRDGDKVENFLVNKVAPNN